MYKKLTCAFCCVISIFVIVAVLYLLFTETDLFSERPPPIQVPKISVLLVDPVTKNERVHHETPDSDLILQFHKLDLAPSEFESASRASSSRKNILRIRCHSNYPVQLKYFGYGDISEAKNRNRRKIGDFHIRSTYEYQTELDFPSVDESITGRFECQVRDENLVKVSTFVHIFAQGSKTFVSQAPHEFVLEPESVIQIPCPVSSPELEISLFEEIPLIDEIVEKRVEPERIQLYDPKIGFVLKPNSYGIYRCKNERTNESSGAFKVFLPLSNVVRGKPLRIYSQNVDNKDRSLKLECRAKEPVRFKFINFSKFFKPPRENKDNSTEFPYSARIKLNPSWFRGNTSIVECLSVQTERVLKTWKFLNQEIKKDDELAYSNPQLFLQSQTSPSGYQCCSSQKSLRPLLRTYPCDTPTECELRSVCLSIDPLKSRSNEEVTCSLLNEANDAIYEGGKGCTMLKVGGAHSGIIRCSLDQNMIDYVYFRGNETEGMYASTGVMSSGRKKIDPSSVLHLSLNKEYRNSVIVQKGHPVRFDCIGSKLYLASGFQWAVERFSEPMKYLTNKGTRIETEPDSPVHHEYIVVPITDQTQKRIYCIAPLINPPLQGQQWINVSLSFR